LPGWPLDGQRLDDRLLIEAAVVARAARVVSADGAAEGVGVDAREYGNKERRVISFFWHDGAWTRPDSG
jgi:hypothetical protein